MVQPKKYLGQHFLTDPSIAERIVSLLPSSVSNTIIEIGPGKGILTDFLLEEYKDLFYAVDIDTESVNYLKDRYESRKEAILEADFLKMDLSDLGEKINVIGNFPYNISSQIFFKVLEEHDIVDIVVCMIQKEVADRIVAPPGSKTYGILSVLLQAYYHPQFHFNVKPGSFFPAPKVTSSVISLKRNATKNLECDEKLFFRIVKATFNQRRKIIRNSLKTILLNLDGENEMLQKRPEQLGVAEFVSLTNWVQARL